MVKVIVHSERPVARRLIAWLTIGPAVLCTVVVAPKIPDNVLALFVGAMVLVATATFILLEKLVNHRANRVEEVSPRLPGRKSMEPADLAWPDPTQRGRSAEDSITLEYGPSQRAVRRLKAGTFALLLATLTVGVLIGRAWLAARDPGRFLPVFVLGLSVMLMMISATLAAWASLVRFRVGLKAVHVTYPFRPFHREFTFAFSDIQQINVLATPHGQRACISLRGGRKIRYADEHKWSVHDFVTQLRSGIERSSALPHPLSDDAVFREPGT